MGRPRGWAAIQTGRPPMWSPGRPGVNQREVKQAFWKRIAEGLSSEDAALACGVSQPVGTKWFREGGGMPPISLVPWSGRYLSFAEREEIALWTAAFPPLLGVHLLMNPQQGRGVHLLMTQYFQVLGGYSPLATGVRLLPDAVSVGVASVVGPGWPCGSATRSSSAAEWCCSPPWWCGSRPPRRTRLTQSLPPRW
jgi:hypothetical protein